MCDFVTIERTYAPSPVEKVPVNFHDDQFDSWYECSNCHASVKQLQKFCGECGKRLSWDMEQMGRC